MDIQLSDRFYLRPDIRGRWWEEDEGNDIDLEGSLAIGFRFGG